MSFSTYTDRCVTAFSNSAFIGENRHAATSTRESNQQSFDHVD